MPVKNPQPFKKFFIEIAINYTSLAPIPKDTAEKSKKKHHPAQKTKGVIFANIPFIFCKALSFFLNGKKMTKVIKTDRR